MNHQAWPAKYGVFFVTVFATLVVPNTPLFIGEEQSVRRCGLEERCGMVDGYSGCHRCAVRRESDGD